MDLIELKNINSQNFKRHPWELARLKIIEHLISTIIVDKESRKIHLVDIGSGDLFVLKQLMSKFSFKSWTAIDKNFTNTDLDLLEPKDHLISKYKDLGQVIVDENENYLILLLDVLEHIENDLLFLKVLKKKYSKTNFNLLITVPSFQSLFTNHDRELLHYRRYTNLELCQIARKAKFEINKSGYFFFSLLLIRFFESKFQIREKKQQSIINWTLSDLISNFIVQLLILDFYITRRLSLGRFKIPGLSNYIICQKYVS